MTEILLGHIKSVLREYSDYWPLTVRQLFYRLVALGILNKKETDYARLIEHVSNARRARRIPFDAIRGDGVHCYQLDRWADADAFRRDMRTQASRYKRDALAGQPKYVEVWCEASGMLRQVANATHEFSVQAYSCSGFNSLTSKKDVANRIVEAEKPAVILHLGDYDPSGESIYTSMTEDVGAFVKADRLTFDIDVTFHRVALTVGQVTACGLPTGPPSRATAARRTGKARPASLRRCRPTKPASCSAVGSRASSIWRRSKAPAPKGRKNGRN